MRAVVQKVTNCTVSVEGELCARIDRGMLLYLGVGKDDVEEDARYLVDKIVGLRIFPDSEGRMNRSVAEDGGSVCVVSQFTLYGDARKGRRPSFEGAAAPELARSLYRKVCDGIEAAGLPLTTGVFQAHMAVSYTNDGPVTVLLDTKKAF